MILLCVVASCLENSFLPSVVDWRRERFVLMKILRQAGLQIVNKSDVTQDEEVGRDGWFVVATR